MLTLQKPEIFNPKFHVVSVFLEYEGKFLLLHRADHKPQGNTWGMPAGKVEENEELIDALIREVKEEILFDLEKEKLEYFGETYVKYDTYDYFYHIYTYKCEKVPEIQIDQKEHKDSHWFTPQEALKIDLIEDEDTCIKMVYFQEVWYNFLCYHLI